MEKHYYTLDTKEVLKNLDTSINGLTKEEVKNRLNKYGKNELPKQKKKAYLNCLWEN